MSVDTILQTLEKALNSNILSLIVQGMIGYVAILWIAVIIWVTKDANNRSNNLLFQILAILLVILLTPLFGLFIYLIIRPSKTLTEKYLEQSQMHLLVEENQKELLEKCENCEEFVDKEHVFCGHCGTKLKKKCATCKQAYPIGLAICPYCGKKEKVLKSKLLAQNEEEKNSVKENPME